MSRNASFVAQATVSRPVALALLAAIIVLWGANWPIMKVGLQYIDPFSFAASRMVLGATIMMALTAATGRLVFPHRKDWPIVVAVGANQMALFMVLVNFGLLHVDAGRSAILAYTTSIWVAPLAAVILAERLNRRSGLGVVLGLTGVVVLFNPIGFDWTDRSVLIGNGLLLLAAFGWALQIIHVRIHDWHGTPLELVPWQFLVGAVLLVPLALALEGPGSITWNGTLVAVLFYNGPLATAFCLWAMVTVTRALPATLTSLATLGVPAAGLVFSAILVNERLSATNITGLAIVAVGLALVVSAPTEPARPHE